MATMREAEIKAMVISALRAEGVITRSAAIANEYCIATSGVRADLAVMADCFVGVEVKSEADTLRRLDRQMTAYRAVFDRVILVVAANHRPAIDREALASVEVWTISDDGLIVEPSHCRESIEDRIHLLTQEERRRWGRLAASSSEDAFRAAFHARYGRTSDAFWKAVGRRKVNAEDLEVLSRFQPARLYAAEVRAERESGWAQWAEPSLAA